MSRYAHREMLKHEPVSVSVKAKASGLPINKASSKNFAYIDDDLDDSLVDQLMLSVTSATEEYLQRSLMTQTHIATFNIPLWCDDFSLSLLNGPIQSIVSITSYDRDNNPVVEDLSNVLLSEQDHKGLITLNYEPDWSDTYRRDISNVVVEYVAGYGSSTDVPSDIRQGMYQWVDALYNDRSADMPMETKRLFNQHRTQSFFYV